MTTQELSLIKDIIESAVVKAVTPLNEELKKIRAIAATTLKEGRERPATQVLDSTPLFKQLPSGGNKSLLEHTNTKSDDQLNVEKYKVINMVKTTGNLPEEPLSEDLIMSLLKGK